MQKIEENLLETIAGDDVRTGAYNIRENGKGVERQVTENVKIETKKDKSGIDIYVKENTKFDIVHIPVIITQSGLKDVVYNDFYIGKNANVVIIAGCGIHNDEHNDSQHDGIHRFFLEEGAKVRYYEKHYGEGSGTGKRILNPVTEVELKKGSSLEMESVQIKGVDSTIRETRGKVYKDGNLVVPDSPNAYKFEAFLFDAFSEVDDMAILRVKREEEFAPVKNADSAGVDCPSTARELYKKFYKLD